MNQNERENFFTEPTTHLMTAQYLNECVHKHIGLAVVDRESDTWGWVHDQHKNESGWVIGETHDDRIQELREGAHIKPALPAEYEKYEFVEETDPTETTYAEPAPTNDPVNPDPLEGSIHTPASFTEGMEAHINDTVGDPINPNYYRFPSGAEVIDITENLTSNGGQVVQYVARSTRIDGKNKGDQAENLRKAIWFLRRELSRIEAES